MIADFDHLFRDSLIPLKADLGLQDKVDMATPAALLPLVPLSSRSAPTDSF
jgi:hypothetical protein